MTDPTADPDDAAADDQAEHRVDEPTTDSPTSWWARQQARRQARVSKWDRPPEPMDWRYVVGTLGKVLIATGVLMFGFVAYQLWGTGIETARAQDRLESAFTEAITATTERVDDPLGAPSTSAPPADESTEPEPTEPEPTDDEPTEPDEPVVEELVPSEIIPGGVDLSGQAVDQDVPPIEHGDVIARLEIPKIDQDLYVVAGVTLDDLKQGPGHYPETPLPGQLGNAAIAGHRTTYGAPFFDVDQLVAGDQLIVTSITGDRFVYEVTGTQVVSAADYWVVTTRDPDVAELTLTSCHPKYTARDRIVVHSVLVPELSSTVGLAEFYDADVDAEPVAGDDPTIAEPDDTENPVTESTVAVPDPTTTEPADTDPTTTEIVPIVDEPESQVPTAPEPGTVDEPEQIDAFSEGWFDDDGAWPQIALWGFALTLISLLAHQVSKATRHDSIGFVVAIFPFLFCLYFFFQNINRLLPPGL